MDEVRRQPSRPPFEIINDFGGIERATRCRRKQHSFPKEIDRPIDWSSAQRPGSVTSFKGSPPFEHLASSGVGEEQGSRVFQCSICGKARL